MGTGHGAQAWSPTLTWVCLGLVPLPAECHSGFPHPTLHPLCPDCVDHPEPLKLGDPPNSHPVWIVPRERTSLSPHCDSPGCRTAAARLPSSPPANEGGGSFPLCRGGTQLPAPSALVVPKVGAPTIGTLPRTGSWCVGGRMGGGGKRDSLEQILEGTWEGEVGTGSADRKASGHWRGMWDQQECFKKCLEQCKRSPKWMLLNVLLLNNN